MFLLLGLVVAAAGLVLCGFLLWRYPVWTALAVTAIAAFWDLQNLGTADSQATLQIGVSLYPPDIACIVLCASCVVVYRQTRALPRDICWPALLLLGLCFLNLVRGTLAFGIKPAGNLSRNAIAFVLPVVAISALGAAVRMTAERIVNLLSITALAFGAVAVARWSGVLPMPEVLVDPDDFRAVVRVLPSDAAIIIGQALIGILGVQLIRGFRPLGLFIAGFFAALVFALQHRSVWVATTAGLVWLAFRSPRVVRREWLKFSSLVLFLTAALVLYPLVASKSFERGVNLVRANLAEAEQRDSTWTWRVDGYSEATQRLFSSGLSDTVIGPPIGADLRDEASYASITIHDRYISVLVYYGVSGLVFLLLWLALNVARIHMLGGRADHSERAARVTKVILEALLVSVLVYMVPYNGEELEGLLMGAIWLASSPTGESAPAFSASEAGNIFRRKRLPGFAQRFGANP